jgi:hypothetical protein
LEKPPYFLLTLQNVGVMPETTEVEHFSELHFELIHNYYTRRVASPSNRLASKTEITKLFEKKLVSPGAMTLQYVGWVETNLSNICKSR